MGAVGALGLQAMAEPPVEAPAVESPEGPRTKSKGAPFMRLMDKLELTEEQEAELDSMRQSHQEELKASHRGEKKAEVLQMLADQDLDREAVHAAIDAQIDAKAELLHAHSDDYLDFIEALDADQQAELAELAEGILKRMEARSEGDDASEGRRSRRGR